MREFQRIKEGSLKEIELKEQSIDAREAELNHMSDEIAKLYSKIENSKLTKSSDLVNADDFVKEKHK